MKRYTTVGHWQSAPDSPEVYHVEAPDVASAIRESELLAGHKGGGLDPFINTVVFAGHCKVVSTWAG